MTKHFLISRRGYMRGLYHRACDPHIVSCTRGRNKEQGTFSPKDVDCKNCQRTLIFRGRKCHTKNVKTKMKIKCSVCGRIYKAIIPRGGDGSLHWPRKHYRNLGLSKLERLQDESYCLGSFTEGKLIEEENE